MGLGMAGAPGENFRIRAPRQNGDALLLGLAGGADLGGGWSLGANLQWLTRAKIENLSASLSIAPNF